MKNILWALARLGIEPDVDLWAALTRRAAAAAGEFLPRDAASLLWAVALLDMDLGAKLRDVLARCVLNELKDPRLIMGLRMSENEYDTQKFLSG